MTSRTPWTPATAASAATSVYDGLDSAGYPTRNSAFAATHVDGTPGGAGQGSVVPRYRTPSPERSSMTPATIDDASKVPMHLRGVPATGSSKAAKGQWAAYGTPTGAASSVSSPYAISPHYENDDEDSDDSSGEFVVPRLQLVGIEGGGPMPITRSFAATPHAASGRSPSRRSSSRNSRGSAKSRPRSAAASSASRQRQQRPRSSGGGSRKHQQQQQQQQQQQPAANGKLRRRTTLASYASKVSITSLADAAAAERRASRLATHRSVGAIHHNKSTQRRIQKFLGHSAPMRADLGSMAGLSDITSTQNDQIRAVLRTIDGPVPEDEDAMMVLAQGAYTRRSHLSMYGSPTSRSTGALGRPSTPATTTAVASTRSQPRPATAGAISRAHRDQLMARRFSKDLADIDAVVRGAGWVRKDGAGGGGSGAAGGARWVRGGWGTDRFNMRVPTSPVRPHTAPANRAGNIAGGSPEGGPGPAHNTRPHPVNTSSPEKFKPVLVPRTDMILQYVPTRGKTVHDDLSSPAASKRVRAQLALLRTNANGERNSLTKRIKTARSQKVHKRDIVKQNAALVVAMTMEANEAALMRRAAYVNQRLAYASHAAHIAQQRRLQSRTAATGDARRRRLQQRGQLQERQIVWITLVAHVARMQRHAEVFTVARDEERQRRREASGAATIIRGVRHWMRVKREQKRQTALRELSKPMLKHLLRWRERRRNQGADVIRGVLQLMNRTMKVQFFIKKYTSAVRNAQRRLARRMAIINAQVSLLCVYWNKVEDERVNEEVGRLLKRAAETESISSDEDTDDEERRRRATFANMKKLKNDMVRVPQHIKVHIVRSDLRQRRFEHYHALKRHRRMLEEHAAKVADQRLAARVTNLLMSADQQVVVEEAAETPAPRFRMLPPQHYMRKLVEEGLERMHTDSLRAGIAVTQGTTKTVKAFRSAGLSSLM